MNPNKFNAADSIILLCILSIIFVINVAMQISPVYIMSFNVNILYFLIAYHLIMFSKEFRVVINNKEIMDVLTSVMITIALLNTVVIIYRVINFYILDVLIPYKTF